MDFITDLFPNLHKYLELFPVCLMGLLSGVVSYFNSKTEPHTQGAFTTVVKSIITCAFLAIISYAILSATDLPYLAKVGISCAIGYFGIDKAIELAQKMINLKGTRSENHEDTDKGKKNGF